MLGTIEVAGPSPSRVAAGREGARDPRAAAASTRAAPSRPTRCSTPPGTDVPREVAARSLAVRVANLRAVPRARTATAARRRRCSSATAPGYRLEIAPEQVDAQRFERERARGGRAARPPRRSRRSTARSRCGAGPPFGDLADAEFAQAEVRRLEDLRGQAEAARARALVELGRPLEAVARAAPPGRPRDPLREELVAHAHARALRRRAARSTRSPPTASSPRGCASSASSPATATRALERRILEHDADARRAAERRPPPRRAARGRRPSGREPRARRACAPRSACARRGQPHRRDARAASRAPARARSSTRSSRDVAAARARGVGQCLGHRGPGEPYMPVLEALGELARGPRGDDGRRRAARAARADVAGRAAVAARRDARRRGGPPPRPGRRRARACCARCSRRSTRSAPPRRSCSCSRTCTGPTTPRSTCSTRSCAGASRRGCSCSARTGRRGAAGEPPVAALAHELSVRGLCEELRVPRLGADAVAAYLAARFPAGAAAGRARRDPRPAHRRQPAVHAQPARPLARRRRRSSSGGGAVRLARAPAALEAGVPPTLRAHIRDQLDRLRAAGRRAAARGERRRARLLRRHARRGARPRPRGGRAALRRARPAARG